MKHFPAVDLKHFSIDSTTSQPIALNPSSEKLSQLLQKQTPFHYLISELQALLPTLPSISGQHLADLIQTLVSERTLTFHHIHSINTILHLLFETPHCHAEVVKQLKKKKVDAVLVLVLCWEDREKTLKVVAAVLEAYLVDIITNGKCYLRKWMDYLDMVIQEERLLQGIFQVLEKSPSSKQQNSNYTDIIVPL